MSSSDYIEMPRLKSGETVHDWNRRRREEIASKRYAGYHRTLVDVVARIGKVRATENNRTEN